MDQQVKHPRTWTDAQALDQIAECLTCGEWDSDTISMVAQFVRRTGRVIEDSTPGLYTCHVCQREFETDDHDHVGCTVCGRYTCPYDDCGTNGEGECAACAGATIVLDRWNYQTPPSPDEPEPLDAFGIPISVSARAALEGRQDP